MKILSRTSAIVIASSLLAFLPSPTSAPAAEPTPGAWRPLFDGKGLDGWEHVGPGSFKVEDGVLRTEGGMGLLFFAREKFGNCKIKVVYKTGTARSNSGVYIRIAEPPTEPWYAVHHGFEVQIMDQGKEERRTGSIYTFAPATAQPAKPQEWNTLEITLKGKKVATAINGQPVAEFDSSGLAPQTVARTGEGDPDRGPRPESGHIGLQNHDKDSIVFFKEVSVMPLGGASN